jgi:hypothetical protein
MEDGGELDEGEEVEGKFLVAGADSAEALDRLEEVLHAEPDLRRFYLQTTEAIPTSRSVVEDVGRQGLIGTGL